MQMADSIGSSNTTTEGWAGSEGNSVERQPTQKCVEPPAGQSEPLDRHIIKWVGVEQHIHHRKELQLAMKAS